MILVHLTASRFFGGPERQMLGLARSLPPGWRTIIVSFPEDGNCAAFLHEAREQGIEAVSLTADTPRLLAARRELTNLLRRRGADVLCCHGYKANILGFWAARRAGIPAVAVSRGWTGESLRVRLYEALDRLALRWMDRVVCVSEGQATKVRKAGVSAARMTVIANAVDGKRFAEPDPAGRRQLQSYFAPPRRFLVGAAGRLSPEKGFAVLIEAAARVIAEVSSVGFVLFGDGPLRGELERQIAGLGLQSEVILAGFSDDLDRLLPFLDVLVLPSFTEGMPNVVLEAMAAGVAVAATSVGGTPEVVQDGVTGVLVPPGDPGLLARPIAGLLSDTPRRQEMGKCGRERVEELFGFAAQARKYQALFRELCGVPKGRGAAAPSRSLSTIG
jgi:glycosyltransferase involved in cell wall biosynthesis